MTGSITTHVRRLQAGDQKAATPLWDRYFERLVQLARQMLQDTPRRAADEEDVALSALDSFCRGAGRGLYPELWDRHNLWRLLIVITRRKALDEKQKALRARRGGGKVKGESALGDAGIDGVSAGEPTPEMAALMADQCRHLLQGLGDDELRDIALRKMEGYRSEEIAQHLGCSLSRIERKLRLIRTLWKQAR